MAGPTKSMLPDCGLYRTTKPLAGHEEAISRRALGLLSQPFRFGIAASALARSTTCTTGGTSTVRASSSAGCRGPTAWSSFRSRASNAAPRAQLRRGTWPKGALVQLGYTRNADPILFIGQVRTKLDENDLWFSDRGVGIPESSFRSSKPSSSSKSRAGEGRPASTGIKAQ